MLRGRVHLPMQEMRIPSLGREDPIEEKTAITLVFLPGKSYGHRSLLDYRQRGCKESELPEQLSMHTAMCDTAYLFRSMLVWGRNKGVTAASELTVHYAFDSMVKMLDSRIWWFVEELVADFRS